MLYANLTISFVVTSPGYEKKKKVLNPYRSEIGKSWDVILMLASHTMENLSARSENTILYFMQLSLGTRPC